MIRQSGFVQIVNRDWKTYFSKKGTWKECVYINSYREETIFWCRTKIHLCVHESVFIMNDGDLKEGSCVALREKISKGVSI